MLIVTNLIFYGRNWNFIPRGDGFLIQVVSFSLLKSFTSSYSFILYSAVSLQYSPLINMSSPLGSFTFLEIFWLYSNHESFQTIVLGSFLLFLPALFVRSISTFSMTNLSFNIEWTLLSHSSQLSLLSSFTL